MFYKACTLMDNLAGSEAQSVARLTREPEFDTRSGQILSFLLVADSRRAVVHYLRKYMTKYWLTA